MEDLTCPNCNVDVEAEELKRNYLRCPTCGFDMSDTQEEDSPKDADWEEEEEPKDHDEEEDEEAEKDE